MMNHTTTRTTKTLAIAAVVVLMLASIAAAATALIGAAAITTKDPSILDFENSATNYSSKQKEKNNCSSGSDTKCTNDATQTNQTQTVIVNNEINNIIRNENINRPQPTITISPTNQSAVIDIETIRLGKSLFLSGGVRPLVDVAPFRIIDGHVSLNLPSANVMLIAAHITDKGPLTGSKAN